MFKKFVINASNAGLIERATTRPKGQKVDPLSYRDDATISRTQFYGSFSRLARRK